MTQITLYSKRYCPLCAKAERVILALRREFDFEFHNIDITEDAALFEKYQYDIPVIMLDEKEFCCHWVNEEALREALKQRCSR